MKLKRILLMLLCLLTTGSPLLAATITDMVINNNQQRYSMTASVMLRVESSKVIQIMSDYNNLTGINPYLLESRVILKDADRQRVSMITKACFIRICYEMKHVQDFVQPDKYTIYSEFVPDLSDFSHGWTRWTATPEDNEQLPGTLLTIELEVEPDFFIFPVIGPRVLKNKLVEITEITVKNLETKAALLP